MEELRDYFRGYTPTNFSRCGSEDVRDSDLADLREYPCGIVGVDPVVCVLSRKSWIEKIIASCGADSARCSESPDDPFDPDSARCSESLDDPFDSDSATPPESLDDPFDPDEPKFVTIPIHERKLDEALGIHMYCRDEVFYKKEDSLTLTRSGTGQTLFLINLRVPEREFIFFGTTEVWHKVVAWAVSCGEIRDTEFSVREHTLDEEIKCNIRPGIEQTFAKDSLKVTDSDHDSDEREPQVLIQPGHSTKDKKRYRRDFDEVQDLGSGPNGSVVEAKNKTDGKVYAVKKVLKEPDDNLSKEKLFKIVDEVEVLAQLSHPNVVKYIEAWVEEPTEADIKRNASGGGSSQSSEDTGEGSAADRKGSYLLLFIQMELCKESLYDKLNRTPESWVMKREERFGKDSWKKAVLEIIKQILSALEYIHSRNLVHSNVKPKNILYDEERRVAKLGDFGLATHARKDVPSRDGSEASLPSKGQGGLYEAPEKLWGTSSDSKVDIYSLGVVLAELLCLFTTHHERNEELPKLRSGNSPAALEEYRSDDTNLVRLVSAMCQRRPDLRPTAEYLLNEKLVVPEYTAIRGLKAGLEERDQQILLLVRYVLHMEKKVASETGTTET